MPDDKVVPMPDKVLDFNGLRQRTREEVLKLAELLDNPLLTPSGLVLHPVLHQAALVSDLISQLAKKK